MSKKVTKRDGEFDTERCGRVLDSMNEGCQIIDYDWKYLFVNDAAAEHGNQTKRNLIGSKMTELYPGIEDTRVFTVMEACMLNRKAKKIENEFRYQDGSKRWFSLNIQPDPEGILVTSIDITDRKHVEIDLQKSRHQIRKKLEKILSYDVAVESLDLVDIVDTDIIQDMMNNFYLLTNIGVAIVDLKGNVLVATGWQDICTKFHRQHPDTLNFCIESDTELSAGIQAGEFKAYKCKNNLWDIATPINIGNSHVGNLFLGQFFYDDEAVDFDFFRSQAVKFGFNEEAYLEALKRVPRWSRKTVDTVMRFYTQFTSLISKLSYSNIKLAKELRVKESAQKSLIESEKKLRAVFDASPIAMVLLDRDGRVLDSNAVHASRLNLSVADLIGRRIWDLLPEEVLTLRKAAVHGVFETGKPFIGEDQRGSTWNQYHIHPVLVSDNGDIKTVIVESIDITDRKKAEKRFSETLLWYQTIFEGSKDAIFISDENAKFVFVNQAACNLTGYESSELVSMRIPDLHEDQDLGAFKKYHARIMAGEPMISEARILRKDGKKVFAEFSNRKIEVAKRSYMHTTARDISDRKLAEKAIERSRTKHQSILKTAMDGFVMVDGAGKIVEVNEAYCQMVGYSEKEILSLSIDALVVGESPKQIVIRMEKILSLGGERFQSRHRRKDGSVIDVEVSVQFL